MISFVIPAYNAGETLKATIDSVLAQDDVEGIVVDDGSADDTSDVAKRSGDARIRLLRQENAGLAAARNAGWQAARGEAVCFLDADDLVRPAFAARMSAALGRHDLVACAHSMAGPNLEDLGWVTCPGAPDVSADRMLSVNPFAVGAVLMRRDAPGRLGIGGPFDETLPVHEDWDLWMRMTRAGATWAGVVDEPLFVYRLRRDSMSTDLDLMWRSGLRVIGRSGASVPAQTRARRHWSIRSLARAVARGEQTLARGLVSFLDSVDEDEVGLLAASMRWAFQREEIVGPAAVGKHAQAWRTRVEHTLERQLADRVLSRVDLRSRDWRAMASAILSRRAPGERIVLYGLGRNGRALLSALCERTGFSGAAYIDDDPGATATGAIRINAASLGKRDLVVVTPEDADGVLERLQAHDRVLTLADIMPPARASA